jgi:hypothetical protein
MWKRAAVKCLISSVSFFALTVTIAPASAQTVGPAALAQCKASYADCLKNADAITAQTSDQNCGSTPAHDATQSACVVMQLIRQRHMKANCLATRNECYKEVEANAKKPPQRIMTKICRRVEIPCRSDGPPEDCYRQVCE